MWTLPLTILAILAAVYIAAVLALYVLEGRLVFPVDLLRIEPAQVGLPVMSVVTDLVSFPGGEGVDGCVKLP